MRDAEGRHFQRVRGLAERQQCRRSNDCDGGCAQGCHSNRVASVIRLSEEPKKRPHHIRKSTLCPTPSALLSSPPLLSLSKNPATVKRTCLSLHHDHRALTAQRNR